MAQWDDWQALLDGVRCRKQAFADVIEDWRDMKYDADCAAIESKLSESVDCLRAIGADVEGLIEAVKSNREDKDRKTLLNRLSELDPSIYYETAFERHGNGTGEWLLNGSEEFGGWLELPGSFLGLYGKGWLTPHHHLGFASLR